MPIKPKKADKKAVSKMPVNQRGKDVDYAPSKYSKGTSSIKPGPGTPAKTPAKKTTTTKPVKKEYDSYIDFFKGNNTYSKGTKAIKKK